MENEKTIFSLRNFWHFLLPPGCDPCAWEKPVVHLFWSTQSQCCRKCNYTKSKSCSSRVPFSFVLERQSCLLHRLCGRFHNCPASSLHVIQVTQKVCDWKHPLPGVCVDIPLTRSRSRRSSEGNWIITHETKLIWQAEKSHLASLSNTFLVFVKSLFCVSHLPGDQAHTSTNPESPPKLSQWEPRAG